MPGNWRKLSTWIEAYTATLEASIDAAMNPEIVAETQDALKSAQAQVQAATNQHDRLHAQSVAQNQSRINSIMGKFSVEAHQIMKQIWQRAARELIAASWDLDEPINFHVEQTDQRLRFWQGESPLKDFIILPREESALVLKFLRFVEANSPNFNPVDYTKAMLAKQGITEKNFHEYADKLGITNPWKPIV